MATAAKPNGLRGHNRTVPPTVSRTQLGFLAENLSDLGALGKQGAVTYFTAMCLTIAGKLG